MALKPIADRVIVRRAAGEDKSRGGILLPDNAKQKPQKGTVEAVGPGQQLKNGNRRPMQVKAGDVVLFTAWAGEEFHETATGDSILVMREEDILAVVDE